MDNDILDQIIEMTEDSLEEANLQKYEELHYQRKITVPDEEEIKPDDIPF